MGIDLNRGVLSKKEHSSEAWFYMYVDEPGVYFNEHGIEIPEALAATAGFDIEVYGKAKRKRELLKDAYAKIEAQIGADEASPQNQKVIAERGEWKVIEVGLGNVNIVHVDGDKLNAMPMAKAAALKLFDQLVPPEIKKAPGIKALA